MSGYLKLFALVSALRNSMRRKKKSLQHAMVCNVEALNELSFATSFILHEQFKQFANKNFKYKFSAHFLLKIMQLAFNAKAGSNVNLKLQPNMEKNQINIFDHVKTCNAHITWV